MTTGWRRKVFERDELTGGLKTQLGREREMRVEELLADIRVCAAGMAGGGEASGCLLRGDGGAERDPSSTQTLVNL